MKKISRSFYVTQSFSGILGEMRVAAELTRYGFRVAKPYWNHDEVDLLLIEQDPSYGFVPIPFQVKSIQVVDNATRYVQGLKRRYVDSQPYLCLAIYDPESDNIWVIDGADNIKSEYDANPVNQQAFSDLAPDDDVRIKFYKPAKKDFSDKWLLDKNDAVPFSNRIRLLAEKYAANNRLRDNIKAVMGW